MKAANATPRTVTPELLDQLHPQDPRALRSRRDLRRLNTWMRNVDAMTRALERYATKKRPLRLLELGSGDGSFLARVSERLGASWIGTEATLLDRHPATDAQAVSRLRKNGWLVRTSECDVFDWISKSDEQPFDAIVTNLFLHHFQGEPLQRLLHGISERTQLFVAVEPRRTRPAMFFSRFVWVIGCNPVTQHDAFVSVQAGFVENELSALWPKQEAWKFEDRPQGWSNHLFLAKRDNRTDEETSTSSQPSAQQVSNLERAT